SQLVLSIDAKPGFEPLWTNLQRLKSHGVRVALDGFVLGDAPIEILRRYPFDLIRFAAPSTGEGGELLASTVRLAHNLGCAAIADRVETAAQAAGLRCSGTDLAVGPFFDTAG
ncbi:MAG: EAL domain-containing protein, partial [Acidimicrobiia bacterium]|nr:EAL domain-containing protein [Acidimicrobiia bacterium]